MIAFFVFSIPRILNNPSKPIILALARTDPKKNMATIVKAFGECAKLRKLGNLVFLLLISKFSFFFRGMFL